MKPVVEKSETGEASLDRIIESANSNSSEFLKSGHAHLEKCRGIHQVYTRAILGLNDPKPIAPIFLLGRAHSAFIGSARLCFSGQLPETYMVLRGVIENALYGFFVAENDEMAKIWLKRDENKKAVKDNFTYGGTRRTLESKHPEIAARIAELYERTIDYGAHPNVLATTTNLEHTKTEGGHHFQMNYLSGLSDGFWLCLKTVPTVGLVSLEVFRQIYRARFDLLGLSEQMEKLKTGL